MKHIRKRDPPATYGRWCTATEDWKPSWAALVDDRTMRRCLVDALLAEQGHLCAYCNTQISAEPGRHHIEHLLPRRLLAKGTQLAPEEQACVERSGIPFEALDIDHRNLLACCPNKDVHQPDAGCGDHKGSRILPLTPLEARCETAFRYLPTGTIESDLDEGRAAIRVLGLDRPQLRRGRREAFDGLLMLLEAHGLAAVERYVVTEPPPAFVVAATQWLQIMAPDDGAP